MDQYIDINGRKHKRYRVRAMGDGRYGVLDILTHSFIHTGSFASRKEAKDWLGERNK